MAPWARLLPEDRNVTTPNKPDKDHEPPHCPSCSCGGPEFQTVSLDDYTALKVRNDELEVAIRKAEWDRATFDAANRRYYEDAQLLTKRIAELEERVAELDGYINRRELAHAETLLRLGLHERALAACAEARNRLLEYTDAYDYLFDEAGRLTAEAK
jgi:hypothetical protein